MLSGLAYAAVLATVLANCPCAEPEQMEYMTASDEGWSYRTEKFVLHRTRWPTIGKPPLPVGSSLSTACGYPGWHTNKLIGAAAIPAEFWALSGIGGTYTTSFPS